MRQPANPGDCAFQPHAEPGVRHTAEAAQIEIPGLGITREASLGHALFQKGLIEDAFAAAGNLAVTFWCEQINTAFCASQTSWQTPITDFAGGYHMTTLSCGATA